MSELLRLGSLFLLHSHVINKPYGGIMSLSFLSQVKGSEVFTHDGTPVAYTVCPTETVRIFIIFTIRYVKIMYFYVSSLAVLRVKFSRQMHFRTFLHSVICLCWGILIVFIFCLNLNLVQLLCSNKTIII